MTVLRSLLRSEARTISTTSGWGQWPGETSTYSGAQVSNETALQLLTVYGCVAFIADGISTLPVDVYRELPDGTRQEAPKPQWLMNPTPELSLSEWFGQLLTSLLLAGNAYARIIRDADRILSVIPLNPQHVQVRIESGRKVFQIAGQILTPVDVLHIPALMFPGAHVGLSPLEAARQTIGAGMSVEEYAARFFTQDASVSGVIEVPGTLTPEGPGSGKEMAKAWMRAHSGKAKAHLPAVLEGGAKWQQTGVTNDQAQFLQTRQFTSAQISAFMFRIDPTEFGVSMDKGSSITYGNMEQRNSRKKSVTLLPWIKRLEDACSDLLARPRFMKFNLEGLLRGDLAARYASYQIGINTGFLRRSEARAFEDLPPIDGIDTGVQA